MRQYALFALLLICSVAHAETIAEKLTRIDNEKTALKSAIEAKGQSVTTFETYSEAVASITGYATPTPDVFPPALEEDDRAKTDPSWAMTLDSGQAYAITNGYVGNGICLMSGHTDSVLSSKLFRSTNYGLGWSEIASVTSDHVKRDIEYCGSGTVIISGYKSAVDALISTDYGLTWILKRVSPDVATGYTCEYLGNEVVVIGTTANGKIFRSANRGSTWAEVADTTSAAIYSIENIGGGVALAGGTDGKIYETTNYGVDWSAKTDVIAASGVQDIGYCGNGIVLCGGIYYGTIYRSTDYGATWSLATDTAETHINSICYCENGVVYAGSSGNGIIFKSYDYGASGSWSISGDLAETTVRRITYIGNAIAIACSGNTTGDNGRIYRIEGYFKDEDRWK